jgi:hypothetical protein
MNKRILIPLALVMAFVAAPATAQLVAGGYIIDSNLTTGGIIYASFVDAAADLTSMGIDGLGDVVFTVNGLAPAYAGFAISTPIAGTSPTARVIFVGAGGAKPIISGNGPAGSHAIHLGGLTSSTTSAGTGPNNLVFDDLEITGATGTGIAGIGVTNIVVRNCHIHNCGHGVGFGGGATGCVVEDNEIDNNANTTGSGGSPSYAGAIWLYLLTNNCLVQRNLVHDNVGNGIFSGSSGSTTATPNNTIINNMIYNCPGYSSYGGGISLRRAPGVIVSHNSVVMPAANTFACIFTMLGGSPANAEISNNLLRHDGTGAGIKTDTSSTTWVPATLDNNGFDTAGGGPVGAYGTSGATNTTLYATLANWQAFTGAEANSVAGTAGFLSATDLHITPASVGFNAGNSLVVDDFDGDARPIAGLPDIGADETPATGLYAGFTGDVLAGPAPHTVNFTDSSYSSDPGGVQTWAWDFNGDTIVDSTLQNPTWAYGCPGLYDVSLTVTDLSNPSSTHTKTGYIDVGDYVFSATSNLGTGDLTITPVPAACYPSATQGFTLISLNTSAGAVGTGPIFGIYIDSITLLFVLGPAAPGYFPHFITDGVNYPDGGALAYPASTFNPLIGLSVDMCEVLLDAAGNLVYYSNCSRVTF